MTVFPTQDVRIDRTGAAGDQQSGDQSAADRPLTTATPGDITPADNQTIRDARNGDDAAVQAAFGNLEITTEHSPWTVMVDLTTTLNSEVGAEAKLRSLLQLAQSTVGSDMTLVVQAAQTNPD